MRKLLAVAVLLVLGIPVAADRGSIAHDPQAKIFEPAQRSIIAWNGKTEMLLLSTDMHASVETRILEILPLPAEPKVKKGDLESFKVANRLIEQNFRRPGARGAKALSNDGAPEGPAAEVTFHEKIGAHDISVAKVLDADRFSDWVSAFVKKNGMEGLKVSKEYRDLIETYLADKFQWFVLDVVDLKKEARTLDPIQYTFDCDYLYYPLRISSLENGRTDIRIIVLTPRLLRKFPGQKVRLEHEPFQIAIADVSAISADMADLLKGTQPFLRIWRCEGELREFKHDLVAAE